MTAKLLSPREVMVRRLAEYYRLETEQVFIRAYREAGIGTSTDCPRNDHIAYVERDLVPPYIVLLFNELFVQGTAVRSTALPLAAE